MIYTRKCPKCNSTIEHNLKHNRDTTEKLNRLCKKCFYQTRDQSGKNNPFYGKTHTLETRQKIANGDKSYWKDANFKCKASLRTKGINNPMYGTCNYNIWIKKFGKKEADLRNEKYKQKLSKTFSGNGNPMYGKPSPQGSGNGWSGWYKDWYFRSLKELSYLINVIEKNGWKWKSAETNDLKIRYIDWKGNTRTYRADFLVENKWLIEVKPTKLKSSISVKKKSDAAMIFCKKRGLEYRIEDVNVLHFEEIKKMYLEGKIKFMKTYENLFKERYLNE